MVHMMHLVFVKEEHEVPSTSLSGEGRAAMVVALQELVKVRVYMLYFTKVICTSPIEYYACMYIGS